MWSQNRIMEEQLNMSYNWIEKIVDMSLGYAPKLVAAILIYFIGIKLIHWVVKLANNLFKKRNFDHSLQIFLSSIIKIGLIILLFLTVISVLGVNITSFAALLAGAGLAVGSAMNGTLGNLAGGVMILMLKPFKIGDLIEAQNFFGIVQEIGIVYTTILTSQNKTIRIPNGTLSTGVVINYTDQENLRIDLKVPILDLTDFDYAKKVAIEAMKKHPAVINDPEPNVRITELTGDGPLLVLWPRIKIKPFDPKNPRQMEADYYSVFFGVRELVYKAFVAHGIGTPDSTLQVTMMNKIDHQP